jgi:hypothetical protein
MYDSTSKKIVSVNQFKWDSEVYTINSSDHHLYFDNPEEFTDAIILDIKNHMQIQESNGGRY